MHSSGGTDEQYSEPNMVAFMNQFSKENIVRLNTDFAAGLRVATKRLSCFVSISFFVKFSGISREMIICIAYYHFSVNFVNVFPIYQTISQSGKR